MDKTNSMVEVFLEKLAVIWLVDEFPPFMETVIQKGQPLDRLLKYLLFPPPSYPISLKIHFNIISPSSPKLPNFLR
jgi:hypothetical protein